MTRGPNPQPRTGASVGCAQAQSGLLGDRLGCLELLISAASWWRTGGGHRGELPGSLRPRQARKTCITWHFALMQKPKQALGPFPRTCLRKMSQLGVVFSSSSFLPHCASSCSASAKVSTRQGENGTLKMLPLCSMDPPRCTSPGPFCSAACALRGFMTRKHVPARMLGFSSPSSISYAPEPLCAPAAQTRTHRPG